MKYGASPTDRSILGRDAQIEWGGEGKERRVRWWGRLGSRPDRRTGRGEEEEKPVDRTGRFGRAERRKQQQEEGASAVAVWGCGPVLCAVSRVALMTVEKQKSGQYRRLEPSHFSRAS